MKIGFWELVVIVVIAFVFIGPDQLPVYAKKLGKMLRELKKYTGAASEEIQKNVVEPLNEIQAPLKEAVAPLTDIKKDIDNSIIYVTKSFLCGKLVYCISYFPRFNICQFLNII